MSDHRPPRLIEYKRCGLVTEVKHLYHSQVSGFRDQGTEVWARENTN
jgi:hypothetical protein